MSSLFCTDVCNFLGQLTQQCKMGLELEAEDVLNCWIREIHASKIEHYEHLYGRERHVEGLCLVSMC